VKIEIFVVETKIKALELPQNLLRCKYDLIRLFNGLTEIDFRGYWINKKGNIEPDFGKLWVIYTDKPELSEDNRFKAILLEIKALTQQKSQAYTINDEIRLL